MKNKMLNKKAQEEMIGFAVIIILVAVVALVLFYFSMNSGEDYVENYKGDSFVQSILDYTTSCQKYRGEYLDIEGLAYSCARNETCVKGDNSCDVLEFTLNDLINQTWPAGEKWPTKRYEFYIISEPQEDSDEDKKRLYSFVKGNKENTTTMKGSNQNLPPKS